MLGLEKGRDLSSPLVLSMFFNAQPIVEVFTSHTYHRFVNIQLCIDRNHSNFKFNHPLHISRELANLPNPHSIHEKDNILKGTFSIFLPHTQSSEPWPSRHVCLHFLNCIIKRLHYSVEEDEFCERVRLKQWFRNKS